MNPQVSVISGEQMRMQREMAQQVRALTERPRSYHIVTFGCQMNVHDSEKMAGMLQRMGMEAAASREDADLVLFNTCCIRENAERKALGNITWLKELKKGKPHLMIGVCGCMMQQQGMAQNILKKYPFVDLAFGTGDFYRLPELLLKALQSNQRVVEVGENPSTLFEDVPVQRESAHKAYVAIAHGCDNFCSYCIVPYVRGRERSREADQIVREVEQLVASGVQEVTLLGQNVNSYGQDRGDLDFAGLLKRVSQTGIPRIRFMTSHPKDLSDALIEQMAVNPNICPHLHLPVQSGSNAILGAMNRRYTVETYLQRVDSLRRAVPHIGLTTDLIVAFPGETEQDFEDTLALVRHVRFDSAFTFVYSPRAGTRAASMPGQIPPEVGSQRIERLIALQEGITTDVLNSLFGSTQHVLVDGTARRREHLTGKSGRNISVNFPGDTALIGRIVPVTITGAGSNTLRGRIQEGETP